MDSERFDRIIEHSLKLEPGFSLSANFASSVTRAVVRREQWKIDLREYLLYSGVIAALVALVSGFYFFIDQNNVTEVFGFLKEHWMSVTTIVLLLNFIFFADKVLLRLLFSRWNLKG